MGEASLGFSDKNVNDVENLLSGKDSEDLNRNVTHSLKIS